MAFGQPCHRWIVTLWSFCFDFCRCLNMLSNVVATACGKMLTFFSWWFPFPYPFISSVPYRNDPLTLGPAIFGGSLDDGNFPSMKKKQAFLTEWPPNFFKHLLSNIISSINECHYILLIQPQTWMHYYERSLKMTNTISSKFDPPKKNGYHLPSHPSRQRPAGMDPHFASQEIRIWLCELYPLED